MAEKIKEVGVRRKVGYLYFVDKDGDISKTETGVEGKNTSSKEAIVGIEKEKGFLYFVDKDGDVGRAELKRGR